MWLQDPKCRGSALPALAGGGQVPGRENTIHPSARLTTASWVKCLMGHLCDEAERKTEKTEDKKGVIAKAIPSNSLATLTARLQHSPEKPKLPQP